MKSPDSPAPVEQPENDDNLVKFPELRPSAKKPAAPEVAGDLAELQSWNEPVDERGHRVGGVADDDVSLGEDLVQQGLDDADTDVRKRADESSRKI